MVADREIAAAERLRAMCPGAVNVLMEGVGYRALRSFGAGSIRLRLPWVTSGSSFRTLFTSSMTSCTSACLSIETTPSIWTDPKSLGQFYRAPGAMTPGDIDFEGPLQP